MVTVACCQCWSLVPIEGYPCETVCTGCGTALAVVHDETDEREGVFSTQPLVGPVQLNLLPARGPSCLHVRALGKLECLGCGTLLPETWPTCGASAREIWAANFPAAQHTSSTLATVTPRN